MFDLYLQYFLAVIGWVLIFRFWGTIFDPNRPPKEY